MSISVLLGLSSNTLSFSFIWSVFLLRLIFRSDVSKLTCLWSKLYGSLEGYLLTFTGVKKYSYPFRILIIKNGINSTYIFISSAWRDDCEINLQPSRQRYNMLVYVKCRLVDKRREKFWTRIKHVEQTKLDISKNISYNI